MVRCVCSAVVGWLVFICLTDTRVTRKERISSALGLMVCATTTAVTWGRTGLFGLCVHTTLLLIIEGSQDRSSDREVVEQTSKQHFSMVFASVSALGSINEMP